MKRKIRAEKLTAGGFLLLILFGSVLLSLPAASAGGQAVSYPDALFTAASAVCVTGLVTVTTATAWSLFGKIVILCLIQIGGLGIAAVFALLIMAAGKRITIGERKFISDSYSPDGMDAAIWTVRHIVIGTLVVEAAGAIAYMTVLIPERGLVQGAFAAAFHAVSCFCNAGMDILGDSSMRDYVANPVMNFTTMTLIFLGGIGFPVWWDVAVWVRSRLKPVRKKRYRMQVHTRFALTVSVILIVAGVLLILLFDWNHEASLGSLAWPEKIMAALFQSVTVRTAGFETIAQSGFTDASCMLSMILMFIGGSPMGTAGGMKTTTVAMVILFAVRYLRGVQEIVIYGRRISLYRIRTALVIVALGLSAVLGGTTLLSWITGADFLDVMYEVVSAIGTVGLSRGLTPLLPTAGKILIIFLMYLGRLGPVTLMLALVRSAKDKKEIQYPKGRILIG